MTYAEHERDVIQAHIERYGRHIIGVCAGDGDPAFAYTIGNRWWASYGYDIAELLVIGIWRAGFLNDLSALMMKRERRFRSGELVDIGGEYPLKIIDANPQAQQDYTIQASNFYGHDNYPVQQVLLPDTHGHFPDDPHCAERYRMPVLIKQ
jgi:hypothetical protein